MTREQRKIVQCVRLAREQFDNIRQDPRNAREYSLIRREAMQDARYWRNLAHKTRATGKAAVDGSASGVRQFNAVMAEGMTEEQAEWARPHDWFHSVEEFAPGAFQVWTREVGSIKESGLFRSYHELRAWGKLLEILNTTPGHWHHT